MQLTDELRRAIDAGEYRPGQRLPSVRALSEQYDVSRGTMQRVLDALKAAGMVESHPPLGIFVRGSGSEPEQRSPEYVEIMRQLDDLQESMRDLAARLRHLEERVDQGSGPTS